MVYNFQALEHDCLQILDICKGTGTQLADFYDVDNDGTITFGSLVEKLVSHLPQNLNKETEMLCKYFFEMVIEYLEVVCDPSDKVFLSFKKLVQVNLLDDEHGESVFRIMIDEAQKSVCSETEVHWLNNCEYSYALFLKYASKNL